VKATHRSLTLYIVFKERKETKMKASIIASLLLSAVQVQSISETKIKNTIEQFQQSLSYLDQNALNDPNAYQKKAETAAVTALSNPALLQEFIDSKTNKNNNFDWEDKHIKNFYAAACIFYATNGVSNEKAELFLPTGFEIPNWDDSRDWLTNPDYCSWFGLACFLDTKTPDQISDQLLEEEIIEIQLFNNSLYGEWPLEVGLLGEHLVTIDLNDNFYQSLQDYRWFDSMNELKYLWFGTTSWEANGIPSELSKLGNLEQLDCSYTFWSEGPVTEEAFRDLNFLQYVDLGDNIYIPPASDAIPDTIRDLPSLIRLYMDNTKFMDENREEIKFPLDFLTGMDSVIEAWFDFTKFDGGIPVLPRSLKSFSCIFCGLTGPLDNISNPSTNGANLDRIWLTGNSLTGTIPLDLGSANADLSLLFLEENDLTGIIPASVCDLQNSYIGGDQEQCSDVASCCSCVNESCGNFPDPTPAPTMPPTEVVLPPGFCFSGENMVNVENRGFVRMSDLVLGDVVQVTNNKFEPIYSFGHKDDSASAEYLQIVTEGKHAALEISDDHMVSIDGGRYVPASSIKKDDMLQTASGESVAVKSIKTITRKGLYAPFTSSGNIIVNDVVASNYIAYQGSEYLMIGDIQTHFSYQWIAHSFNSFHRVAVMMGFTGESYTKAGVSNWVNVPHKIFSWVLDQNKFIACALLFPAFLMIGFALMIEILASTPFMMFVVLGAFTFMTYKKAGKTVEV